MMNDEIDGEREGSQSRALDARPSRRQMLQAAVAGGVGVVAWSTPSIRSVGGTPAYAQACSPQGPVEYKEDGQGANVNCSNACDSLGSFGWLGAGNNKRNFSGPGFSASLTFVPAVPECGDVAREVTIVATRDSDGAALDCDLTGVFIEAINNTDPVPAVPRGSTPVISNGEPAPIELCTDPPNPYVDCTDPENPVWQGVAKTGGIGNLCSSQWLVVMECWVDGCRPAA